MAENERQIRVAAETLLSGSINSQRSSCTQHSITRTPDIVLSEDLIAGARQNGRMSNVRRFFCLFVTFDLLLTGLVWLICTMIAGESLETAFLEQVVHYHIKTSLFDIVMGAICRFTVLLLFYAVLYWNHWIVVAISTTGTCAFLIAKVFLFDWSSKSQPVYQVLLIITSFVLAWTEAWFFDFRVLPQETQARNWIRNFTGTERSPLLETHVTDTRQYTSDVGRFCADPAGRFYTPMESPNHSDNEDEINRRQERSRRPSVGSDVFLKPDIPQFPLHKIEEYKKRTSTLLLKCHELLVSNEWKVETKTSNGDVISYMELPKPDGRIVRITGVVDAPAGMLVNWLFEDIEASPSWNKLVTESSRLQQIDENTDIIYQATSPQGGGLIGARDFVILRHRNTLGNYYISSGISVRHTGFPNRKHVIRGENGVGCWAAEELEEENKCRFTWILNTNLKGWLPQKLVERSMSSALIEFMGCLRKHLNDSLRATSA